jgi:putative membrane protein
MLSVVVGLLLVFRNGSAYARCVASFPWFRLSRVLMARSRRWDDGRRTFAKMVRSSPSHSFSSPPYPFYSQLSTTRSLSRTVWINIGAPTPVKGRLASDGVLKPDRNDEKGLSREDQDQKVKALRLMVAFVVATKHHVRLCFSLRRASSLTCVSLSFLFPALCRFVASMELTFRVRRASFTQLMTY